MSKGFRGGRVKFTPPRKGADLYARPPVSTGPRPVVEAVPERFNYRVDAIEAALALAERGAAAALEHAEFLKERAGRCQRNMRLEDLSWELCDEPAFNGATQCEKHLFADLPQWGGSNPIQHPQPAPAPHPFDPADDPAIDAPRHLRIGTMFPIAYRPPSDEAKRKRWTSSRSAAPPPPPPNPTLEREREAEPFPVRIVRTVVDSPDSPREPTEGERADAEARAERKRKSAERSRRYRRHQGARPR